MDKIALIGNYDIIGNRIIITIRDNGCEGKIIIPKSLLPKLEIIEDGRCEIKIKDFKP